MFLRLFFVVLLLPLGWGVHEMHLSLIEHQLLKQDVNAQVHLMPPEFLRVMTFGHDSLMADLLWLQLIQYYGAAFQAKVPAEHLYAYFDTVTSLDPDFETAYTFAPYLLDETPEDTQLALKILKKGEKNMPDSWSIPYRMGFLYYLRVKNVEKAAQYFQISGQKPGAPELPTRLAAQLYKRTSKLDDCILSLQLWQDNMDKAPTAQVKEKVRHHLVETKMICDLLVLREGVKRYAQEQKSQWQKAVQAAADHEDQKAPPRPSSFLPQSLDQLEQAHILARMIRKDPLNRPYVYNPADGSVKAHPLPWSFWDLKPKDVVHS